MISSVRRKSIKRALAEQVFRSHPRTGEPFELVAKVGLPVDRHADVTAPAAAVRFRAAGFVGLIVGWREGRHMLRFESRAHERSIERKSQGLLRSLRPATRVER